jgi:1-acyl-sn-glycerol-3-phosphate acyltransferase
MKAIGAQNVSFGAKIRQCLSDVVYEVFRVSLIFIFRIFYRVRVVGRENCPKEGPLLIVCNHISEWDPPFLGSSLPWQANWLAKVELFELLGGCMKYFFEAIHCVPIDRTKADLSGVKHVVRLLKLKRPVAVFAEGGIRTDETSLLGSHPQLKEGAASMALLASCPILPCLLNGTVAAYRLQNWNPFKRKTLEVVIGPVFQLETKDRAAATQQILERMLALKPKLEQQNIS